MTIWQILKKNYSNYKNNEDLYFSLKPSIKQLIENIWWDIFDEIDEWAKPICPICNRKMSGVNSVNTGRCMQYTCFTDKLHLCADRFFSPAYFIFLGSQYSEKQFKNVLRMKAFW